MQGKLWQTWRRNARVSLCCCNKTPEMDQFTNHQSFLLTISLRRLESPRLVPGWSGLHGWASIIVLCTCCHVEETDMIFQGRREENHSSSFSKEKYYQTSSQKFLSPTLFHWLLTFQHMKSGDNVIPEQGSQLQWWDGVKHLLQMCAHWGCIKLKHHYFTLDVNCGRRSSLLLIVIVRVIKLDAQRSIDWYAVNTVSVVCVRKRNKAAARDRI